VLATANSTLRFAGESQQFSLEDGYPHTVSGYYGGLALSGTGTVEFSRPEATITLLGSGNRDFFGLLHVNYLGHDYLGKISFPSFSLGAQKLVIRSDQTWLNPSRTGSLAILKIRNNEPIVIAADEKRLDNLGNVAFAIYLGSNQTAQIPGGTYQSIRAWSGASSGANVARLELIDDVTLAGGTVLPGNRDPEEGFAASESDYSLHLMGMQPYSSVNLIMNGHALTTARGILAQGASTNNVASDRSRIEAAGATLDIGGNLTLWSDTRPAGTLNDNGALYETRNIGIWGDEDTVVTLRGSFITNVRSPGEGDGLHLATVNLIGGSAEAPNTFEVGADPADEVAAGTYAIGTLNVGSAAATAHVRLVNDYINDGDADNPAKTGAGEVLLAGNLTIAADSLLDAGGQGVKIDESLTIDATGILDLNLGIPLTIGEFVPGFTGVGDQVDEWNESRFSVIDTSNSALGFKAVLYEGNTCWLAVAGNATLLLIR